MADSSKILLSGEENSEQIKIDPSVLEVILGIAAEKVDGVAGMRGSLKSGLNWVFGREDHGKGVNISVDDDNKLIADIYVYLESGVNVPKVAMTLQKKLKAQLLQMTDLDLKAINVHVVGSQKMKILTRLHQSCFRRTKKKNNEPTRKSKSCYASRLFG